VADLNLREIQIPYYGVKEAVFPFNMFPEVDPVLGPEMRSTGEVLGWPLVRPGIFQGPGRHPGHFAAAGHRAVHDRRPRQAGGPGTGPPLPRTRVYDHGHRGHPSIPGGERDRHPGRFQTGPGQAQPAGRHQERPGTPADQHPSGKKGSADSSHIRKAAIKYKIPYVTTTAAALAAAKGIEAIREGEAKVRSLQSYHGELR
jgi:carbamoyl-phosphate synthase large subunit